MDNIEILPFSEEMLDSVVTIEKLSFSEPWSKASFESALSLKFQSSFAASAGGKIIGYICLMHIFDEGEVLNLAVDPHYRKQGIGDLVLSYSIDFFEKNNIQRITLEVRESNIPAKTLYTKRGFTPIAVRKGYYSSPREDGIVMEKILRT